jgi:type I restriction enzyme M protein
VSSKELIEIGIKKGYIRIEAGRVTHLPWNKNYDFTDPEESVRAETYVELIEKYHYQPQCVELEKRPPAGVPEKPADLVIWEPDRVTPFLVVECKKRDASLSEIEQGIRQLFGNANAFGVRYALLDSRIDRRAYYSLKPLVPEKHGEIQIGDIPENYAKPPTLTYGVGIGRPLSPVADISEFQRIMKRCHDALRDIEHAPPLTAFTLMSRLIFTKVWDERNTPRGSFYDFQAGPNENPEAVTERIVRRYIRARQAEPNAFPVYIGIESPQTVKEIAGVIGGLDFSRTPLDIKGDAYQNFLGDAMRGPLGQYFTPRAVVVPIIQMMLPEEGEKVIDPACGTGGFLVLTLDHIRNLIRNVTGHPKAATCGRVKCRHW